MKKFINIFFVLILIVVSMVPTTMQVFAENESFNNFSSTSYVLLDADSGEILTSFNENEKLPVASICKLMTTLITLEEIEAGNLTLEDEVLASEHAAAAEGSQAFLDAGSKYKIKDLLKSVIVASANDSAIVLAECISGNEQRFVERMNIRANELGMKNTVYQNATGLNTIDSQHSTALDTAIILKEVEKFDTYNEYCTIWMDELVHPSGRVTELVNTNRLIRYYDYCKGGKTGFTDEAGYCLSSSASNGDLNLIAVVLNCSNASNRFKESMELYSYGFANFENAKIVDSSIPFEEKIEVVGGKKVEVSVHALEDFYALSKKGEKAQFEVAYELPNKITAPKELNAPIGKCFVTKNGVVVAEIDMGITEKLEKQTFKDVLDKIVNDWRI